MVTRTNISNVVDAKSTTAFWCWKVRRHQETKTFSLSLYVTLPKTGDLDFSKGVFVIEKLLLAGQPSKLLMIPGIRLRVTYGT